MNTLDRTAAIQRVVHEVGLMRRAGLPIELSVLAQSFPELMPELGTALAGPTMAPVPTSSLPQRTELDNLVEQLARAFAANCPDYEVLDGIGRGGQGVVVRARERRSRRQVAIKVLLDAEFAPPRRRERFAREFELAARLHHTNVVPMHAIGDVSGRPYFVMDHVVGTPIDQYVLANRLSTRDTVQLAGEVCRTVGYAHQRGVIHRDLKPSNILVDADGRHFLLDFGLAKDEWSTANELTQSRQFLGTLPYAAPEQMGWDDGESDTRSDVYALGVVCFLLLAGRLPYEADPESALLPRHVLHGERLRLRQALALPDAEPRTDGASMLADLEYIVGKALEKKKSSRYQSANELADDLERALRVEPVYARREQRGYVLRRTLRRYQVWVATGLTAMLLMTLGSIAITALYFKARDERENARLTARAVHESLAILLTEIDESISSLAGGVKARDSIIAKVQAQLDQLLPLIKADASLSDLVPEVHVRKGDASLSQGRPEDARRHYEAALDALEGAPSQRIELRARRMLASASPGSFDEVFGEAIALGEHLSARGGGKPNELLELIETRLDYGQRLFDSERPDDARRQADAAIRLLERGLDSGWRWQRATATAWNLHGRASARLGDGDSAEAGLRRAYEVRTRSMFDFPANVRARHDLMRSCLSLAEWNEEVSRSDVAGWFWSEAVEQGEYLARVDPTLVGALRDLQAAYDRLAAIDLARGDHAQARWHVDCAAELATYIGERDPDVPAHRRAKAFALARAGDLAFASESWIEALLSYDEARAIREELRTNQPNDASLQRDLAVVEEKLGHCFSRLGDRNQAWQFYSQGLALRTELAEQQPSALDHRIGVAVSYYNLSRWHRAARDESRDACTSEMLDAAEHWLQPCMSAGADGRRWREVERLQTAIQSMRNELARQAERRGSEPVSPG